MKTGDLVIFRGLVNPELNIQLEADEYRHTMNVWNEEFKISFWWEPIQTPIEGHIYCFGFNLKNLRENRIECEEEAARHLNIEELHAATVAIIRDVF
ncbi:hypothetical protein HVZ88_25415 (plasmid) [Escherichia coli]|nr:hypothetical protein HVZ88_25415 [Escherichia coli]